MIVTYSSTVVYTQERNPPHAGKPAPAPSLILALVARSTRVSPEQRLPVRGMPLVQDRHRVPINLYPQCHAGTARHRRRGMAHTTDYSIKILEVVLLLAPSNDILPRSYVFRTQGRLADCEAAPDAA